MCKRFLYVGGMRLPDRNAAAHRVLAIAKLLRELGYEVSFLDIDEEMTGGELSPLHLCEGFEVRSQRRPTGTKDWARYILNPLHVEEVLTQYPDTVGVIAYNYPAVALRKLRKICRKRGLILLSDCTEWYVGEGLSLRGIALRFDSFYRMRVVQKRLDGMIAISSFLGNYYEKHLPTVTLPPMTDLADPKWQGERTPHEGIRLSYAGSPGGKNKDRFAEILRAVGNCENVFFQVVGITADECKAANPDEAVLIDKLSAEGRVLFRGRLSHAEALAALRDCDYAVFFRQVNRVTTAGFPTKFAESISCGVPVITNRTSDLESWAEKGCGAVLLPTDDFSAALGEFLSSPAALTPPAVRRDTFDYRGYAGQVEDFLRQTGLKN